MTSISPKKYSQPVRILEVTEVIISSAPLNTSLLYVEQNNLLNFDTSYFKERLEVPVGARPQQNIVYINNLYKPLL